MNEMTKNVSALVQRIVDDLKLESLPRSRRSDK